MEDTDKSQECGEFPQIHKLLLMFYPKFQPYSKTAKQNKEQKRMEMGQRISEGIRGTQREDNKSTGSFFAKKRGKIQSGNRCFRTCYRRSAIPGTRWEVETDSIFIEDDATSRKKS